MTWSPSFAAACATRSPSVTTPSPPDPTTAIDTSRLGMKESLWDGERECVMRTHQVRRAGAKSGMTRHRREGSRQWWGRPPSCRPTARRSAIRHFFEHEEVLHGQKLVELHEPEPRRLPLGEDLLRRHPVLLPNVEG